MVWSGFYRFYVGSQVGRLESFDACFWCWSCRFFWVVLGVWRLVFGGFCVGFEMFICLLISHPKTILMQEMVLPKWIVMMLGMKSPPKRLDCFG